DLDVHQKMQTALQVETEGDAALRHPARQRVEIALRGKGGDRVGDAECDHRQDDDDLPFGEIQHRVRRPDCLSVYLPPNSLPIKEPPPCFSPAGVSVVPPDEGVFATGSVLDRTPETRARWTRILMPSAISTAS